MSWTRMTALAAALGASAVPLQAEALTQASGPVMIGPSVATGDAQNHSADLSTMVTNHGDLPDRLINVSCPTAGTANLLNGHVETIDGQQRNGLDIPAALGAQVTPVQVQISLTKADQPVASGALIPCSLYFRHAGQRIIVFMVGEHEQAADEP